MRVILAALALHLVLPTESAAQSYPGDHWPVSTPEAEGVDPVAIRALHEDLASGVYGLVDRFFLIRHGRVIADYTYDQDYWEVMSRYDTTKHMYNYDHPDWHPYLEGTRLHSLQSVTKSVNSAALGIALDRGLLAGVDVPAMPLLSGLDPDLSDPRRAAITVEDLLTMRSGISWTTTGGYSGTEHSTIVMELSRDWLSYILSRPMDRDPGTFFQYNDGASVLLGRIIKDITGRPADEWTRDNLFEPIGIKEFFWKRTPMDEVDTEGGLYLKTEDLARFGYLFLRDGRWGDRQVISEEWVRASTRPVIDDVSPANNRPDQGYGYQWWIPDHEDGQTRIFAGNGYGGQFVLVAPEYDMVAVFNGWNIHGGGRSTYRALQDRILPATERHMVDGARRMLPLDTEADEYGPALSPDGRTIYYTLRADRRGNETIVRRRWAGSGWGPAEPTSFSGEFHDKEPFVTPDGGRIFFASTRPAPGGGDDRAFDLWYADRLDEDWGTPVRLGPAVNSADYDNYPSVAANGNLYFGSRREGGFGRLDLYVSRLVDGVYQPAENLGPAVNSESTDADPYIAPDESYLIFSSTRPGGAGSGDLYVCFRNSDNTWGAPQSLGPVVNGDDFDYTPLVTPDGGRLLFSRGWGDLLEVDVEDLPVNLVR